MRKRQGGQGGGSLGVVPRSSGDKQKQRHKHKHKHKQRRQRATLVNHTHAPRRLLYMGGVVVQERRVGKERVGACRAWPNGGHSRPPSSSVPSSLLPPRPWRRMPYSY